MFFSAISAAIVQLTAPVVQSLQRFLVLLEPTLIPFTGGQPGLPNWQPLRKICRCSSVSSGAAASQGQNASWFGCRSWAFLPCGPFEQSREPSTGSRQVGIAALPANAAVGQNDDAIRAIQLYCGRVADACLEGAAVFNERVQSEAAEEEKEKAAGKPAAASGRVVVEIKQQPRRGRGAAHAGRDEREAPAAPAAPPKSPEPEKTETS